MRDRSSLLDLFRPTGSTLDRFADRVAGGRLHRRALHLLRSFYGGDIRLSDAYEKIDQIERVEGFHRGDLRREFDGLIDRRARELAPTNALFWDAPYQDD